MQSLGLHGTWIGSSLSTMICNCHATGMHVGIGILPSLLTKRTTEVIERRHVLMGDAPHVNTGTSCREQLDAYIDEFLADRHSQSSLWRQTAHLHAILQRLLASFGSCCQCGGLLDWRFRFR